MYTILITVTGRFLGVGVAAKY